MAIITRCLAWLSNALMVVAGIAMILMMLQIGADIAGKYLFNAPVIATLEIVSWYYMVAVVFLPLGYIQRHRKHLQVELFTRKLPPRRLAMLEGLVALMAFVYVGILFSLTLEEAIDQTMRGEIQDATFFDLPVWPSRWMLPLGVGAMALMLLLQAVQDLLFALTGQRPAQVSGVDEAPADLADHPPGSGQL